MARAQTHRAAQPVGALQAVVHQDQIEHLRVIGQQLIGLVGRRHCAHTQARCPALQCHGEPVAKKRVVVDKQQTKVVKYIHGNSPL